MHHKHLELGATMVESEGWQRPGRYVSVDEELERVQSTVGLSDISPVGKLSLQGSDLEVALRVAFGNEITADIGTAGSARIANGPADEPCTVARLAQDEAMVLTAPDEVRGVAEALGPQPGRCAHLVDVTSALAGVRITGPASPSLLAGVTELNVEPNAFPSMGCAQGAFAEISGLLLRLDLAGLLSYDLYFGREFGEYLWDALLEAGEEFGVTPIGIEAMARYG
jgi:sarcosine oxidase subunit alpha